MAVKDLVRATARMGQLALMRRELALVTRDASGGWRHRYLRGGTMVTPQARKGSWRMFEAQTRDIFFYDYTPSAGDVIVELGAGCGTETLTLAATVGPTGRVIACEAHPWTADLLRRTLAANGTTNVEVVHAAITDRSGTIKITDNDLDQNIGNTVVTEGQGGVEVPALSLDDLCDKMGVERIDLLKVNIEGAEGPMLDGMERTVSKIRHGAISCHDFAADILGDDSLRTRDRLVAYFTAHGFEIRTRPDDGRYFVRDYQYLRPRADCSK